MRLKAITYQQKSRVLNKLFSFGVETEKDLQKLTLENILAIKNITIPEPEMAIITELQKQVKAGTLYSYLAGGESDEQNE